MKTKFIVFLCALFLIFCMANTSGAVVITFNDLEASGTGFTSMESYSSNGFTFTSSSPTSQSFYSFQQSNNQYYGSASLFNTSADHYTFLRADSGNLFDLNSIDLHRYSTSGTANVTLKAYDASDSLLSEYSIDLTDGLWNKLLFGSTSFKNISYLKWQQTSVYHMFDNVGVTEIASNPVPEPSTILLLGAGLVGLVGARRKLKK